MTNKEKLSKLLAVAVENGWRIYDEEMLHLHKILELLCFYRDFNADLEYFSLNDLVLNWEEDATSFMDALYNATQKKTEISLEAWEAVNSFGINWILMPTSKRLDYLFETFKHLL